MLVLLAIATLVSCQQICTKITTRYEVHDMPQEHIEIYRQTIRQAITTPDPENPQMSIWESAASYHNANAAQIHNSSSFFFWHRLFLAKTERKLQAINPNFYFPYWDSSREWNSYQNSKAIQITDLSDTIIRLNRVVDASSVIPSSESYANQFQQSVKTGQGFDYYHSIAETIHGNLHIAIGGEMATMYSPRDPLFYMHHGRVDYEWSKCQHAWGTSQPQVGGYLRDGTIATMESILPGYGNRFADVFDLTMLCVAYAPIGSTPPSYGATTSTTSTTTTTTTTVTSTTTTNAGPVAITTTTTSAGAAYTSTSTTISGAPSSTTTTLAYGSITSSKATSTTAALSTSTYTPVNTCPKILPDSWLRMNGISPALARQARESCEKVVTQVAAGVTFKPAPVYSPQEYKAVVRKVTEQCNVVPKPVYGTTPTGYSDAPATTSTPTSTPGAGLYSAGVGMGLDYGLMGLALVMMI